MPGIGFLLILLGILEPDKAVFKYGPLPVILAGAATFLGGVTMLARVFFPGETQNTFVSLSVALLLTCFAGVPIAIVLKEHSIPLYFVIAFIGSIALIAWHSFFQSLKR